MADDELLNRFLDACESAKVALERQDKATYAGLGNAIRATRNDVVKRNFDALSFLVGLRNTIQHSNHFGGQPIASPRADAVEEIEKLADQIERPPAVRKFMTKSLVTVRDDTPLPGAARLIIEHSLSQLPVTGAAGRFEWLLTTNAVARWLSAKYDEEDGSLIEEGGTVADVRPFGEDTDVAEFVRPDSRARRVCDRLSSASAPAAVVVTSDGKKSGSLEGIVTRFDVPTILRQLDIRLHGA